MVLKMEVKELLERKFIQYNSPEFIETDPIRIPHLFSRNEDREISGFIAATLAWGQRVTIINNSRKLMDKMGSSPFDFVMSFKEKDLQNFYGFVHRTFNFADLCVFFWALKNLYQVHGGMENIFVEGLKKSDMGNAIAHFRNVFFQIPHPHRTEKHVSNPLSGASAKRINMFLRWMIRKDNAGVDFGIWQRISPGELICPLDVHSGRVARKLGLLSRKQNDWKAAIELTSNLKLLDENDPVKYDFALFGLGVFEKF
jgi:uncharacterized protein (TIGR02757 family)